jgi:hypothetical protein
VAHVQARKVLDDRTTALGVDGNDTLLAEGGQEVVDGQGHSGLSSVSVR